MDVFEAIKGRRSIGKVKPDPVDRQLVEKILEAAVWAPSYHNTEPWRFFVLTGEGRRPLGQTFAAIAREEMADPTTPGNQAALKSMEARPFRAPVVIVAAACPSDRPDVMLIEEVEAVAAAIQNMLLAAHALGLATIWRTGHLTYHPAVKQLFGLGERDEVLGFIYVGYPDIPQPEGTRAAFEEKTVWLSE